MRFTPFASVLDVAWCAEPMARGGRAAVGEGGAGGSAGAVARPSAISSSTVAATDGARFEKPARTSWPSRAATAAAPAPIAAAGTGGAPSVRACRPAANAPRVRRAMSPGGARRLGAPGSLSAISSPVAAATATRGAHGPRSAAGRPESARTSRVATPIWLRSPVAAPSRTLATAARRQVALPSLA